MGIQSSQFRRLRAARRLPWQRALLATALGCQFSAVASAQTTWNAAIDATWSNANNWSTSAEPLSTDHVVFPTPIPTGGGTVTLSAGEVANQLTFNDLYTLTGGDLTLTTGTITNSAAVTIASVLQGTAGLSKSGAGTLTLSETNTYSGQNKITGGIVLINGNAALGATPANATVGSGNILLDGGELQTSAAITLAANRGIALGTSGTNRLSSASGNLTYAGIITNAVVDSPAALTIAGGFVPGGQSTYSGGTTIASGTTIPTASSTGPAGAPTSGPLGTALIDFTGGGMRSSTTPTGGVTLANPIRFSANATFTSGSATTEKDLKFTGPITLANATAAARTLTVATNPTASGTIGVYLNGAVGQSIAGMGLTKAGSGILYLNGANTYTGITSITGGTMVVSGGSSLSSEFSIAGGTNTTLRITNAASIGTGRLTAANGSTTPNIQFRLDGGGTTALSNHFGINSSIVATIDVNNNGTGSNGVISMNPTSTGGLGIGNGTINVTGGNGYRLQIDNIRATAAAGTVRFNPTTANLTLGNVFGSNANNHTFNLDGTATDNRVTGAISNTITTSTGVSSVIKSGTGTWILSGNNNYTGTTAVNAGKLVINGNQSTATGNVTVAGGATIGGSGTIGGATTIAASGILAPGNSIGTLNLANSLTLASGSLFEFELAAPGTNDLVSLPTQTLTLNNQQFSNFTFLPETGFGIGTYTLFDAGTIGGSFTPSNGIISFGGTDYDAALAIVGNDLVLNVSVIPEPSTLVLAGLGVLGFAGLHLRRRRRMPASILNVT